MTKGNSNFRKTIVEVVQLLNDYKVLARHQRNQGPDGNGVVFVHSDGKLAAPKGKIEFCHCSKKRHYKNKCPKLQDLDVGIQNLLGNDNWELDMGIQILHVDNPDKLAKHGWAMVQTKRGMMGVRDILSPYHVYINTCASYASTPHPQILHHLMTQEQGLVGHSNAGLCRMNSSSELSTIKQMWLNKGGIATIILLTQIKLIWPVSYNSCSNGGSFVIHSDQGDIVVCNSNKSMPFINLWDLKAEVALGINEDASQDIIQAIDNADIAIVQTVRSNMNSFTKCKVNDACAARKSQAMLGHTTDCKFLGMVRNNINTSCHMTPATVMNACTIFGPDLTGVRGRSVRRPSDAVMTEYVKIP
jgi:hypothetical protein